MADPVILFFLFGVMAGLLKVPLRLPSAIYDLFSVLLLLAIGLKGGQELSKLPLGEVAFELSLVVVLGIVVPLILYPLLRLSFKRVNAASLAAHYGSVSVGTFAVCLAFLGAQGIAFEEHAPAFVVMLEIPAILIGIVLARGTAVFKNAKGLFHEVFLGKSVVLLVGSLLIAWIAGPQRMESLNPFFQDLFPAFLAIFLLDMGMLVSQQFSLLRTKGPSLIAFGLLAPLFLAVIGIHFGILMGLSIGGVTIMGVLSASASYIAVPAAFRMVVPEANPGLSLAASLGVTFPFNVTVGIPLYYKWTEYFFKFWGL